MLNPLILFHNSSQLEGRFLRDKNVGLESQGPQVDPWLQFLGLVTLGTLPALSGPELPAST